MKLTSATIFLFLSFAGAHAQTVKNDSISRKKIQITRIDQPIKIDGHLDEEVWKNAAVARNFVEFQPKNGNPEAHEFRTEVRVLYDDTGIYFGAKMYDPEPSKIAKELVERDNVGNDDFFDVVINGYNDHQQSLEFIIMPSGVQFDAKMTNDYGEDSNWSAVWYSGTNIDDEGWTAELKIPYSELRFPKKDIQEWGLNFVRLINRTKVKSTWNFIDNKKGSFLLYDGVLQGIENIQPPLRLSFLPYFSTYLNNFDGKTSTIVNGGMDVKYGINDAFTLDTTLIPDFGQTAFDDNILNLGPFEQQFSEKRSFFTEGTELFSKGNLFYSRRVGDYPSRYPELSEDETLVENLQKVKLLNATKISGRTNKGLGIGFFNAITKKTEVDIKNNVTGEIRTETVEPLANYNVFVFDQRFNGNSSVSLINTNVTRAGDFRDANATAFLVDLTDKKNKYNFSGAVRGSYVRDGNSDFGTNINAGLAKIYGKSTYQAGFQAVSKDYNIDDLGYTGQTNYVRYSGNYGYRMLQPSKNFNNINLNININYARRLETDLFKSFEIHNSIGFQDKKFRNFGAGLLLTPNGENDLYEPRVFGKYLYVPAFINPWIWFNSDNRKKFTYNFSVDYYAYDQTGRYRLNNDLGINYRLNDHFSLNYNANVQLSNQEQGFAGENLGTIYIGNRNRSTVINGLSSKYTINNKMALTFSLRHYYTEVNYTKFGTLEENGLVTPVDNYSKNNQTYNSWNVDMRYSWWFAPGSQLTLLYQNAAQNYLDYSRINFGKNFSNLFNEPMNNTLSLKVSYYIDYNQAKNWFKQKS